MKSAACILAVGVLVQVPAWAAEECVGAGYRASNTHCFYATYQRSESELKQVIKQLAGTTDVFSAFIDDETRRVQAEKEKACTKSEVRLNELPIAKPASEGNGTSARKVGDLSPDGFYVDLLCLASFNQGLAGKLKAVAVCRKERIKAVDLCLWNPQPGSAPPRAVPVNGSKVPANVGDLGRALDKVGK